MEVKDQPNQFRQTTETTVTQRSAVNRALTPAAIGLGLLLIVGGIVLGIRSRNQQVAQLPEYEPIFDTPATVMSPVITSPAPTVEPTPSPAESPSATPTPAASPSEMPQIASNPVGQVTTKGGQVSSSVKQPTYKTASAVKKQSTQAVSAQQPNQPQPSPTPSTQLPEYQPVVVLPEYQPQFITPSPSPAVSPTPTQTSSNQTQQQTVTTTLNTPGHSYRVTVSRGSTVLAVLQEATRLGFSYRTQQHTTYGSQVIEINGQSQPANQYWVYTINDGFALGVSSQTVNDGDVIVWKLT